MQQIWTQIAQNHLCQLIKQRIYVLFASVARKTPAQMDFFYVKNSQLLQFLPQIAANDSFSHSKESY